MCVELNSHSPWASTFGRKPGKKKIEVKKNGRKNTVDVETFTWEKLDHVDKIKRAFKLN